MSDNGIRRGRGMVWKRMDGRIAKEGTAGGGTRFTVSWGFRTTETSDEGRGTSSLCIRGESSHGSRTVEGCSRGGDGDSEREWEEDSPESDQAGWGRSKGFVEGTENPSEDF